MSQLSVPQPGRASIKAPQALRLREAAQACLVRRACAARQCAPRLPVNVLRVLCLVVTLVTGAAPVQAGPARPHSSSAATAVTAFVVGPLALHVLALESLLATTDWHLRPFCHAHGLHSGQCAYPAATGWSDDLGATLAQQARLLTAIGDELAVLLPPQVEVIPARALALVMEDLILFSAQVAALLQETATDVAQGVPLDVALGFGYWPAMDRAAGLLSRAEGWLETADHATGARARLPGFAPGQSLREQLYLLSSSVGHDG
jgi:hypothetical protein